MRRREVAMVAIGLTKLPEMMVIMTLTKFDGGDDRVGRVDGIEALTAALCQGWMTFWLLPTYQR